MSTSENTQLTNIKGYKPSERMRFSEPIFGSVPNSNPKIEFKRISISTLNNDGTEGELILPTERLFSFGVSKNLSQDNNQKINGYVFPLCMWSKDGPTTKEKEWTDTFDKIVENCIDHVVENRDSIDMYELERSELTKTKGGLNPLYWKMEKQLNEKGKPVLKKVEGQGPTLYAKLIYSKKNDKFITQFFDLNDQPLNAMDLEGQYCHATSAIKIESIFISGTGKISLQVKLYESVVEPSSSGMKRLLKQTPNSKVLEAKQNSNTQDLMNDNEEDDEQEDTGSIGDESEEKPKTKTVKKRTVKKRSDK